MSDSSASYIHMQLKFRWLGAEVELRTVRQNLVQHLIEKCLIFHMTKEECMEALSKHANIKPVITSTVWNELEKENKEFFESYTQSQNKDRMTEAETSAMIQKMISNHDHDHSKDSEEVGCSKDSDKE